MFAALVGVCTSGWADAKSNSFGGIFERNPFGLKPPPPPVEIPVPLPPLPPLATVEVTGITSILSNDLALVEIIPGPGKPMIRSIMAAGERIESIEVVEILLESNEVVIRNGGVVTNVPLRVAKSGPPPAPKGAKPVARSLQSAYNSSGRNGVMPGSPASSVQLRTVPLPALPQSDR